MTIEVSELIDNPELPEEIVQAGQSGQLVLFVGAGLSRLIGIPGWSQWADKCLDVLIQNEKIEFSHLDKVQLKELPDRTKLSIAFQIAKKEGVSKSEFLACFEKDKASDGMIYTYLNKIGAVFVTTNYDEFIEPELEEEAISATPPPEVNRIYTKDKILGDQLTKLGSVIHLHGAISRPDGIIATTKNYLTHYDHENIKEFLGELFNKYTVLFLGYGLEEMEILEHILRKGVAKDRAERKRFILNGFFSNQQLLHQRMGDYYRESFGVHLIGFLRDSNDFNQQTEIIKDWAMQIEVKPQALAEDLTFLYEVLGNE